MHATDTPSERPDRPLPHGFTAYYSVDRFVLLSPSYLIDCSDHPYSRLSATLLIGCRAPFRIEAGREPPFESRAVLIAPGVPRRRVDAPDCDLAILDFTMLAPEFGRLQPLLHGRDTIELDPACFAPLLPALWEGFAATLPREQLRARVGAVIDAICGPAPPPRGIHPRVARVMQLIQEWPLRQATPAQLASQVHLSPSRLRHLFKQEAGVTLRQYARYVLLWRGISLWLPGAPLTEIAHRTGAYDLAHFDHVFQEAFGRSPSSIIGRGMAKIIRCD